MVLRCGFPDNGPIPTFFNEAIMLAILLILSAAALFAGVRLTLDVLDIVPNCNDDLVFP